jgi:multiple sugar transport system substrate-binding protein/sn-glycerol 3-phosphate transport system substrate-binding protein
MLKHKNLIVLFVVALVGLMLLAACGGTSSVEQAVEEAAQQVEEEAAAVEEAAATIEVAAATIEEAAAAVEEAAAAVEDVAAAVEEVATAVEEAAEEEAEAEEAVEEVEEVVEEAEAEAEEVIEEVEEAAKEVMVDVDYDTELYGIIDDVELDGTKVVFWHRYEDDSSLGEVMAKIIDEFNANNPYGVTIQGSHEGGYGGLYDKMIAGLATGDVPGMIVAYQNQAAAYQMADGLISLDPYISHPEYGLTADEEADFFQAFIDGDKLPQFGGESYGFPLTRSMEVMMYNVDWLQELFDAGTIDFEGPPQTPEQFAAAACAASANPFSGNTSDLSVGAEVDSDASQFASQVFAYGGDIYDYEAGQFTYDTPEAVEALTFLQGLTNEGCIAQAAEKYGDQTDFGNGKALLIFGSSAGLPFISSAVDDGEAGGFAWSVAAVPHTTVDPVQNIYGASTSVVKTDPATQLASWLFLKHWTSPEMQAMWAETSNYFPTRNSVSESMGDYFAENEAYATAFDLLQYGRTEAPVAGYDNIRDEAEQAFIAIVYNGEDAASTLETLNATANQLLADSAP